MGALLDADSYAFTWLSAPYLGVLATQSLLLLYVLFTRGNPVMRTSLITAFGGGVVFALGQAAGLCADDPQTAVAAYKLMIAPVALIGPAILALQATLQGQGYRYRALIGVAAVVSVASCALAFGTDLMVDGVWVTDKNVYFATAGPLLEVHLSNLFVWEIIGAVLLSRRARVERAGAKRKRYIRFAIVTGLLALANLDVLLAHRIGAYPMSWLPLLLSSTVLIATLPRIDLVRTRGRDWATAWELLVVAVLAGFAFLVVAGTTRVVAVVLIAPALAIAHAVVVAIRARSHDTAASVAAADRALDLYTEHCAASRDAAALDETCGDFVEDELGLTDVRVLTADSDELSQHLDARVKAWILANRGPLLLERLGTTRLGGLRAPVQRFFASLGAAVVLPLVDRDSLVGVVAAGERADGRALSDRDVQLLAQVQDITGRTLTWLELYREAEERVEVAREVEVAAAVQHARAPGEAEVDVGACKIASHYKPAGQFGGDWWSATELPDGRVLVMIGDVTGHGVPAALVTATVEGCCETAQQLLGSGFDVFDLMHLLNRSVLDVGKSEYLMSCFAALIDADEMTVTFANAGHPFPYVCRPGELRALVSRGMPLGVEAEPTIAVSRMELQPEDIVVLFTDALVESENAEGKRYGYRGLQRALRRRAAGAGPRACREIMDDALLHYGERPIREDITLVCVTVGAAAG